MFLWWPSIKNVQAIMICQKHGRQGAGLIFPIYLYRKLKNLLDRNHWTDVSISWLKCFYIDPLSGLFNTSLRQKHGHQGEYWPSIRIVQDFMIRQKHGHKGKGFFSLYIYIANCKDILVRNHWTVFDTTWQKYITMVTLSQDCSSSYDLSKP